MFKLKCVTLRCLTSFKHTSVALKIDLLEPDQSLRNGLSKVGNIRTSTYQPIIDRFQQDSWDMVGFNLGSFTLDSGELAH